MPKKALGRGLKALIPETPRARAGFAELPPGRIHANPHQPRQRFDVEALEQLAASIGEHGVLQPLLVSEDGKGGYLLLAGERRWRAAQMAGLEVVPVVIREQVDSRRELEMALVENLQRRDLTSMEEARAYEELRRAEGLSQAEIAARVGFDRSTIANSLRLLKLPEEIQQLVEVGKISAGHARALINQDLGRQRELAERVLSEGLSVRQLERLLAEERGSGEGPPPSKGRKAIPRDPNLIEAEERLKGHLGVPVHIRETRRGGKIVLECPDREELLRVYEKLMGGK